MESEVKNYDNVAAELKQQFRMMRRGVQEVVISQTGRITIFCKSEQSAAKVRVDMVRVGRKQAKIVEPNPFTMGCYLVEA